MMEQRDYHVKPWILAYVCGTKGWTGLMVKDVGVARGAARKLTRPRIGRQRLDERLSGGASPPLAAGTVFRWLRGQTERLERIDR